MILSWKFSYFSISSNLFFFYPDRKFWIGFIGHHWFLTHNPMYYFLRALSFLDACFSSVITPKMLVNYLSLNKTISYLGCAAYMFVFITSDTIEFFIFGALAYDNYEAIYKPLLYSIRMSPRVYVPLIIFHYIVGIFHGTLHRHPLTPFSFSPCHTHKPASCLLLLGLYWDIHYIDYPNLLWFHSAGHSEEAFCWKEKKSLLYMWLSSNWSVNFSWYCSFHVCETNFQLCLGSWHDGVCVLHHCDSHAESHHL